MAGLTLAVDGHDDLDTRCTRCLRIAYTCGYAGVRTACGFICEYCMKSVGEWFMPDADTYFAGGVLKPEGFEIDKLERALHVCHRWRTAIDGGAHIGTWSTHLARHFRNVLAFEPAVDTYECLALNVGKFPNVVPFRAALGCSDSRASLSDEAQRPGNTGARYIVPGDEFGVFTIDHFDIDDLDFLKLDLEGYEYFALLGGAETIRACRPVICLETKAFGGRYGIADDAALKLLASWGARHAERMRNDHVFLWV